MNQSFFKRFTPVSDKFLHRVQSRNREGGSMFLIYDPVHLIKNLRNNWITERTRTLAFPLPDHTGTQLAVWSHLQDLSAAEERTTFKLSALTKAAVSPSNIQKQSVSLVLQVFLFNVFFLYKHTWSTSKVKLQE